jgi:hypothetical protein
MVKYFSQMIIACYENSRLLDIIRYDKNEASVNLLLQQLSEVAELFIMVGCHHFQMCHRIHRAHLFNKCMKILPSLYCVLTLGGKFIQLNKTRTASPGQKDKRGGAKSIRVG